VDSLANSGKEVILTAGRQRLRLDKFLATQLPKISRSALKTLIEDDRVTVNGEKKRAHYILKEGEKIAVSIPPAKELHEPQPQEIPLEILYEDKALLVINKQAGLVVHPAAGHRDKTLVNALLYHIGKPALGSILERQGIVHRLDRDTSGVMVIAKTQDAYESLAQQFKAYYVQKAYLAVTHGIPKTVSGVISLPIGRHQKKRKKMTVREDGRQAVTEYRVLEEFGNYALVLLTPKTGRTHQIRVHLKSLGTPVLCDATYSRRSAFYESELRGEKRKVEEKPLIARQALHAKTLTLRHPLTGELVTFEAPLPRDFQDALTALRSTKLRSL
jgi:23S rRNA pseudouridine1911/1915/1917 synthase